MTTTLRIRKMLAWVLIVTLANPLGAFSPAFARDTDIFLATSPSASTAEPNVLVVLDTSDSMNIPEPWREYPGEYDSHVEYLWNDIAAISNSEVTIENASRISTAAAPATPFSPWGTWAGNTLDQRRALWNAARTYANATETGDPGPRNTWRNYNDPSWLYWVPAQSPATTSLSDARLRSISFNRFRGSRAFVAGTRGGITFAPVPNPWGTTDYDYTLYNQCSTSLAEIMPSTVFAPTAYARNAGFFANQQWARYERWLALDTVNNSAYPGSSINTAGYARGYLDSSVAPLNTPTGAAARDNIGGSPIGSVGLPIRVRATTSHAGWTDLKADMAGTEFHPFVSLGALNSPFYPAVAPATVAPTFSWTAPQLTVLRSLYGYSLLESDERLSAIKGTRDNMPAPAFGMVTGLQGYINSMNPAGYGSTTPVACDPATGPASLNCINVPSGTVACTNRSATQTRTCTFSAPTLSEVDASGTTRWRGGSCTNNTLGACSDPFSVGCPATPANCGFTTTNNFFSVNRNSCAWSGRQSVTVNACSWVGRTGVFVEGQGWYHYGGSCQENGSTASCTAGGTTATVNGISQSNVTGPQPQPFVASYATQGCTNAITANTYWYGGTCQGNETTVPTTVSTGDNRSTTGPSTANCSIVATASVSIRGTAYANVVGGSATGGCNVNANTDQTCGGRYGLPCPTTNNVTSCPSVTTTNTQCIGGSAGTNRFYRVYNYAAPNSAADRQINMIHDCKADEPTGNPSGSYMRAAARTFDTAWNTSSSPGSNATASYSTAASEAIAADSTKNIDVYSVNYLNWKFGPKGPNGHPIGRKTRLQIAKGALTDLAQTTDGMRLGLMVFNRTSSTLNSDGANVAFAMRRMGSSTSDPDFANRAALASAILATTASARTPMTEALYEAYLYYAGRTPQWGTSTATALGGGTVTQGRDTTAVCTAISADCPSIGVYRSPMLNNPTTTAPAGCQKNYIILITDGGPEDDSAANTLSGSPSRGVKNMTWTGPQGIVSPRTVPDETNSDTTSQQFEVSAATPFGPTDLAGTSADGGYVWLDELAYFMSRADISPGAINFAGETTTDRIEGRQSAVTYTIGFAGASSPVLQNAAQKSGGQYYVAEDSAGLKAALLAALVSIRDWNPTVSAPTVPISALNRTTNSTDVYLSFFRASITQAWTGTVKKFMLGDPLAEPGVCGPGITDLCLIGQTVLSGVNTKNIEKIETDPATGIQSVTVDPNASSFWGPSTLTDAGKPDSGGTGYQLINTSGYNPSTRKVYTRLSTGTNADLTHSSNAVSEGNTDLTKTLLGNAAMSDTQRSTILNWALGGNPGDAACADASTTTACTAWRSWAHGDVQHSRPALVTYNPGVTPPTQYLYYASSTGYIHAVDANTGAEKWTFLVEEALPQLAALMANATGEQIYVADGSPVVQINDANKNGVVDGTDSVWLFFGLRRGGRAYYALDITDVNAPRFMWKITPTQICGASSCSASTAYAQLGQSWSTPTVGRVRAVSDPVLLFGGGYDPNQDNRPTTAADTMGRAVFVANARTGSLEASFSSANPLVTGGSMSFSIPSDLAALDTDMDGNSYLDRIYVGDMGGQVWRFDIGNADKSLWSGRLLATLATTLPTDRRIFFPPAAVKQLRLGVRYDAVIVGTGNREHPLKATSTDVIAMIKDPDYGLYATSTSVVSLLAGDLIDLGSTEAGTTDSALIGNPAAKGWYRVLDTGEKVTSEPTVFFGRIRFGSYTPIAQVNACVPPGQSRLNELDLLGAYVIPAPTTGMTRYYSNFVNRGYGSSGQLIVLPGSTAAARRVFFVAAADARLFSQQQATLGTATRVYWYTEPQI
ncbi:MAG: PQQ-binding-like beta-propeller repeat protein [Rhodocyclaceae bacterium]|nr:PQQ-binding-like beta-propeller repeat protein [Rhodocyclaceae bacterium]